MRLDRFLSLTTELSRSQARKVVQSGRVRVDGERVKSAAMAVAGQAEVILDGRPLRAPRHRYLMLNKPPGVICATEDAQRPTVIDLLADEWQVGGLGQLHPAGRLDIDTTGLVLISDDGQWTHNVTSPRKRCWKRYRVTLDSAISEAESIIQRFAEGLQLNGEKQPTLPAMLEINSACTATVLISEGRYHQVKRMFAAVGNRVTALHRDRIGEIELDPALAPGACRELTDAEVAHFQSPVDRK